MRNYANQILKSVIATILIFVLFIGLMPMKLIAAEVSKDDVAAQWKFSRENASGEIPDGTLQIKDVSNNGNDLVMQTYQNGHLTENKSAEKWDNYLNFSNESIMGNGSIEFSGIAKDKGADFITNNNAPINKETFENGYTIEVIYFLPNDWTNNDKWMGLLARQLSDVSSIKSMDEPELGSTSLAVSNCKEFQYLTANMEDSYEMKSAAWSIAMDKGGQWYHLAITCDEEGNIKSYLNGAESFRNFESTSDSKMIGMYADPNDGRFRIGSSWWKEGNQTLDKFLNGNIEEIRISKRALPKSEWLIENPESLAKDFGRNDSFSLNNRDNYNFVFIPDTQNTVKFKRDVMDIGIDELIGLKDIGNIKAVAHLGDVVENFDDEVQFMTSRDVFYKLPKNNIKTLVVPGNHDYEPEESGYNDEKFYMNPNNNPGDLYYSNYFGKDSEFHNMQQELINDSPSGRSSYMKIKAGSYKYLMIGLSWYDFGRDSEWFEDILKSNPDNPTIIVAHNIADCSDTEPSSVQISEVGEKVWNVIKDYNQVFMTFSGHFHGAGNKKYENSYGNSVHVILADYQFSYNGGNSFFKFAEFDEDDNRIYLKTFSPYAASLGLNEKTFFDVNYMNGAGNDDVLNLDFNKRFDFAKKIENNNSQDNIINDSHDRADRKNSHDSLNRDNRIKLLPTNEEAKENKKISKIPNDIKGHWAYNYINQVVERGLMDVYDNNFYPNKNSTRLDIVKAMAKLENINIEKYKGQSFKDIDKNSEESAYINWARENNIIAGYEDNTFKKDKSISREEIAAILNRYVDNLDKKFDTVSDKNYIDNSEISDWAKDDVNKATQRNLLEGRDNNKFDPKSNISRGEVAVAITKLFDK
ncbi:hypothetical protein ABID14_001582 [Peptoniphilus olsenii]|uniref:SLH domain-containing protein n=1 Tax=Peptoniphilus olsenii TaxID=411570 RepID=A0ABV2JB09_9FIRM